MESNGQSHEEEKTLRTPQTEMNESPVNEESPTVNNENGLHEADPDFTSADGVAAVNAMYDAKCLIPENPEEVKHAAIATTQEATDKVTETGDLEEEVDRIVGVVLKNAVSLVEHDPRDEQFPSQLPSSPSDKDLAEQAGFPVSDIEKSRLKVSEWLNDTKESENKTEAEQLSE